MQVPHLGHIFHNASRIRMSCDADPNLWMKAEYRPEDKLEYYSYILCYVDDILCIHHDPDDVLNKLNGYMPLQPSSVRNPISIWAQA